MLLKAVNKGYKLVCDISYICKDKCDGEDQAKAQRYNKV